MPFTQNTHMHFSSSTSAPPLHHHHPDHSPAQHAPATIHIHAIAPYESSIYDDALAQLQNAAISGNSTQHHDHLALSQPDASVHRPAPSLLPPYATGGVRHDSGLPDIDVGTAAYDWQFPMQTHLHNSMGGAVTHFNQGVKRLRSHQRTPSASTVASNGPASPYMHNGSYPHIASTDQSPNSPAFHAHQALLPKDLPTPSHTPVDNQFLFAGSSYIPSQAAHMPSAHLAMKGFGINHHNPEDFLPDFAPSRQSMSSYGTDSPATPQSGAGDVDTKQYAPQNGEMSASQSFDSGDYLLFDVPEYRQGNPHVQLYRTESQAYQDELYDPSTVYTSAPAKQTNPSYLSPHRNLLGQRLQTANLVRSASPASGASRGRSPFRDGSPLAPTQDWRPQGGPVGTAASMRQQQKEEAARAEYAQHRPTLQREPTKTISPKDALLDYHDNDEQPLFHDTIPTGYEKHMGGTEQWPSNNYLSQPGASFGDLPTTGHQNIGFRNATADSNGFPGAGFDLSVLPHGNSQLQNNSFQTNYPAAVVAKMNNNYSDPTPDFPATIPSMESSISDVGMPPSSQESNGNGHSATPQRPDDTRANTGTYTCTYHGCTQRFDSHNKLQKHKRDYHRSQQQAKDATSPSGTGSTSPRSTESPGPSTGGMTSAALLARNSQAGPHKCTRINPSTNRPCNTIFSRPYDLTRHEDTIHNGRKQKVRCPMCREEKTFSRNDALTRHMRVVHPEVESFGKRGRRD